MSTNHLLRLLPAALVAAGTVLTAGAAEPVVLHVTVKNDLAMARPSETVELTAASLNAAAGAAAIDLTRLHVSNDEGREVLAQAVDLDANGTPESLIFQADIPASGKRTFDLRTGEARKYKPQDFKAYARFVRERYDDFFWENDRTAHRMYGQALETWEHEPLTSSTVDVWLKRTRRLVGNEWYMTDDYHRDNGEGGDFYSAGKSRGCGGSGLWLGDRLAVSKNFRQSRVLANGPIRVVFELTYPLWDAPGVKSETKRVTLDAGQNFSRFESRYDLEGAADARYAVGIKHDDKANLRIERDAGWMRAWAPVKGATGEFGCAVVLPKGAVPEVKAADGNDLMIVGLPATYWAGAGWDRSGDFQDVAAFDRYIEQWVQRINSPLVVEVTAK